jgi:hypothetical protein
VARAWAAGGTGVGDSIGGGVHWGLARLPDCNDGGRRRRQGWTCGVGTKVASTLGGLLGERLRAVARRGTGSAREGRRALLVGTVGGAGSRVKADWM